MSFRSLKSLRSLKSFHVISCHFMSFHVISCHFMSFHVIYRWIREQVNQFGFSCHFSCHFMSFHVILCHFISFIDGYGSKSTNSDLAVIFHVISCHFMSFHVISCHFMSFHVLSCPIMSFHVSWDFFEQLSLKSGGAGEGQICLPRPSATYLAVMPSAKMLVHLVSPDVGLQRTYHRGDVYQKSWPTVDGHSSADLLQ
jgi:hypothetical protein